MIFFLFFFFAFPRCFIQNRSLNRLRFAFICLVKYIRHIFCFSFSFSATRRKKERKKSFLHW